MDTNGHEFRRNRALSETITQKLSVTYIPAKFAGISFVFV